MFLTFFSNFPKPEVFYKQRRCTNVHQKTIVTVKLTQIDDIL